MEPTTMKSVKPAGHTGGDNEIRKRAFGIYIRMAVMFFLFCAFIAPRMFGCAGVAYAGEATVTQDYFHHQIHEQNGFTCSLTNTTTNIGEMTVIAFNTKKGDKHVHMLTVVSSSAGARFGIYRDPSIDVGEGTGTATVYNLDENAGKWSIVSTIDATPTVNAATYYLEAEAATANITKTIELMPLELASGSGPFAQGGSGGQRTELIYRSNSQYAHVLTATSDDTGTNNITLFWYEHEHRSDGM